VPRSRQNLVVLLIAFAAGAAMFILWRLQRAPYPWERPESSVAPSPTVTSNAAWLKAREEQADQTVWAKEMLAQQCGRVFESLWDSVNASTNKLETVAKWNPAEVVLGDWRTPQLLPHGIEIHDSRSASGGRLSPAQWSEWVSQFGSAGWQLDNIEFRHNRFDVDARGQPAQSRFYFAARL